jgi:hypothetical protein
MGEAEREKFLKQEIGGYEDSKVRDGSAELTPLERRWL